MPDVALAANSVRQASDGIAAFPGVNIGKVKPDGAMTHQDLARTRRSYGNVYVAQNLRPAIFMNSDRHHHVIIPCESPSAFNRHCISI